MDENCKTQSSSKIEYPKFNGWDWTEVIEYFHRSKKFDYRKLSLHNKKEPQDKYEDRLAKDFTRWLWENHENKVAVKICRLYVKKLYKASEQHLYNAPIWKGLYKVEHDETFVKYFNLLFQAMWC